MLSQGLEQLTESEIENTLGWVNYKAILKEITFNSLVDMDRLQRLSEVQWISPDCVLLIRPRLQPYLIPSYLQYQSIIELIEKLEETYVKLSISPKPEPNSEPNYININTTFDIDCLTSESQ